MAKQMPKHLEGYVMVEDRLPLFYDEFKDGRITTEVIAHTPDSIITKSSIFADADQQERGLPLATGICKEVFTNQMPKYVEVCETSSIGRALANYQIRGLDENGNVAKRPSLEEMQSVQALQEDAANPQTGHLVEAAVAAGGTLINSAPPLTQDDYVGSAEENQFIQTQTPVAVSNTPQCPTGHGDMVWKEGISQKTNEPYAFWSCSQFPTCRNSADKDGKVK
jgi:ssDNA-binding Zn-finger/Zn-ribbon topoisomerase 1